MRLFVALLVSCAHPAAPVVRPAPPPVAVVATPGPPPPIAVDDSVECGCNHCDPTVCSFTQGSRIAYAWSPDAPTLAITCANRIALVGMPDMSILGSIKTSETPERLQVKGSLVLAEMADHSVYEADFVAKTLRPSKVVLEDPLADPTGRVVASVSSGGKLVLTEGKVTRSLDPVEAIHGFSPNGDTVFVALGPWDKPRIRGYSAHSGARRPVVSAQDVVAANTADAAIYSHAHTITWVDLGTGKSRVIYQDDPHDIYHYTGLAVSHDDRWLVMSMGMMSGNSSTVIDTTTGQRLERTGPPCVRKKQDDEGPF